MKEARLPACRLPSPRALPAALVLAALLGLATAPAARPQEREKSVPSWSGLDGFVMLLQQRGMRFRSDLDSCLDTPDRRVLVVLFGRPPELANLGARLSAYAERGGPVVIASDRPRSMNPILAEFDGVELVFDPSYQVRAPSLRYKSYADCPILTLDSVAPLSVRKGAYTLAMNKPAYFRTVPDGWERWAKLAESEWGLRDRPCILGHERGNVVLISDHSLFINLMLSAESNLPFASNLIDSFRAREVALVVDGKAIHPAMFPPGFPDLSEQASVRVIDRALRALEESGTFRNLEARTVAYALAALGVAVAAALALWLLRQRTATAEVLQQGPALLVDFGRDTRPGAGERNLRIPAQEYVQAWWKRFRLRHRLPAGLPLEPGRVEIAGGSPWARRALERDLAHLAELAQGRERRVPLSRFQRAIAMARHCDEAGGGFTVRAPGSAPVEDGPPAGSPAPGP